MTTFDAASLRGKPLTPRECEVLVRCARGQKLAAFEMGLSLQTIKNHCSLAYAKLGVQGLTEAYLALGWLHLPDATAQVAA